MTEKPPIILTIAGFDPSSGAGVTADIKTIAAHGCYGVACITAMTVQSTAGVRRLEAVDPQLVADTLQELATDMAIAAVHIWVVGPAEGVKGVAGVLGQPSGEGQMAQVVLQPLLKTFSRAEFLGAPLTKPRFRKR